MQTEPLSTNRAALLDIRQHPETLEDTMSKRARNDADDKTTKKQKAIWTQEEDELLLQAVVEDPHDEDDEDWESIKLKVPGKTAVQCLKRYIIIKDTKKQQESEEEEEEDDDDDDEIQWTHEESELLKKLVEQYRDTAPRWTEIAQNFPNHSAIECLSHWQSLTNPPVIKGKGSWTAEEDAILREKRALYGRKWAKIAAHLPGRQGKQCRERFVNHLDPELKKGEWTDDEEAILIAMHQQYGNRWASIAKHLPGRSDNDTKNHWYSTIQRKFQQHGREKLVEAALQQVQMMKQMGTMPAQQPQQSPWPAGPYNQATGSTQPPPPPPQPHHYAAYPPPPYAYAPPPNSQQATAIDTSHVHAAHMPPPYMYAQHAHMPPPPPQYYHYGPPPQLDGTSGGGRRGQRQQQHERVSHSNKLGESSREEAVGDA